MSRLFSLLFAVMIAATPALAGEWPAEARMQMEAAGARLSAADATAAERVAALREIAAIAKAYPDAPDARMTAMLMSRKATMEAGPGIMLDSLATLAASGQVADTKALASIAGPMLSVVAEMQENDTLLPSVAIELDTAIKKIDSVSAKAGLPKVAEAISQVSGDSKLGAAMTGTLNKIAKVAKFARQAPNLAELDRRATKNFIDNIVSIGPPIPALAVNKVGYVMFRDSLAWEKEMFGETAKGLHLVANTMETGKLDQKAFNEIRDRFKVLKKGPWDSDTARDVLKSLCKAIPVLGAWCDDAFKLAEELGAPADCRQISCDCQNIRGGLSRGALIVQCKIQEQSLISECRSTKAVTRPCLADAKGPAATY